MLVKSNHRRTSAIKNVFDNATKYRKFTCHRADKGNRMHLETDDPSGLDALNNSHRLSGSGL